MSWTSGVAEHGLGNEGQGAGSGDGGGEWYCERVTGVAV
jgi:hypothetical protein